MTERQKKKQVTKKMRALKPLNEQEQTRYDERNTNVTLEIFKQMQKTQELEE